MVMKFSGQLVHVEGNEITIKIADSLLINTLEGIDNTEYPEMNVGIVDQRHLSIQQRKKAYATMNDMASYLGYDTEDMKHVLKNMFYENFGSRPFSFSNTEILI